MDKNTINQRFAEKLFLHILKDLFDRRNSRYLYDRINCARLLRQLLIDGDVLCYIANRTARIKIYFTITEYGEKPEGLRRLEEKHKRYLIEDPGIGAYLNPLKLEQYLSHQIANYGGDEVTVREIIKYVANNYGGVHLDPGKEDKRKMHLIDQTIHANGEGAIFALVSSIINTALSALFPLRDAILEMLRKDGDDIAFSDEYRMIDPIQIPKPANEKKGTISLWLRNNEDPKWYIRNESIFFPPLKNAQFELCINKDSLHVIHIDLKGLLGNNYSFQALVPDVKTISPQHGIHIHIVWDYPEITLTLHGKTIETKKMQI